jgi:hypothetical protein
VVKNVSIVSILRVLTKRAETMKKPEMYPLRYAEDFFGGSNEVAVKLSKRATGNHFSLPCEALGATEMARFPSAACSSLSYNFWARVPYLEASFTIVTPTPFHAIARGVAR